MKKQLVLITALAYSCMAVAGDVYVSKDAGGNLVYTDTPQTIPAERLNIKTADTDTVAVQQRYATQMEASAKQDQASSSAQAQKAKDQQAAQALDADRAKRCADARQQYQTLMNSWRVYEDGPNGERVYLDSSQIDAARQNAKQVMDQFCGEPQP